MFGLGIGAEIGRRSVFDRKNYFYPDLPKGYQISQFEVPSSAAAALRSSSRTAAPAPSGITRAHLEEDAGKSAARGFSRARPVSTSTGRAPAAGNRLPNPDLPVPPRRAYLKALQPGDYLGISDGNMAEGSMRCDINLSLRPAGSDTLGTRAEIKNVNSFRFVEKAIRHEIDRQADILEDGGKVVQETRLYDADLDETRPMRSKEVANDYRYFPEPDLLPVSSSTRPL